LGDLIIKDNGKVALQKTKKLLSITEKILAERKNREVLDTSWVKEIVKWSREFNLGLPESYEELIKVRGIFARGYSALTKEKYQEWHPEKDLSGFYFSDTAEKKIFYIPKDIGNLSNLTELYLSGYIEKIPESIGNLSYLKWLSLSENQIREIPQTIGSLSNLKRLYLDENPLSDSEKSKIQKLLPNTKIEF
jgi:Leucine-rich repeat (LRR) protein